MEKTLNLMAGLEKYLIIASSFNPDKNPGKFIALIKAIKISIF